MIGPTDELYESFGGREFCRRLSSAFYSRVARDPLPRPLFPSTFTCATKEFAAFLAQFLGGPAQDRQRRWWLSLGDSYKRSTIGPRERRAWLRLMNQTLEDIEISRPQRESLRSL